MDRALCGALVTACILSFPSVTTGQRGVGRINGRPSFAVGDVDLTVSRVYTHVFKKTSLGHEHAIEGRIRSGRISSGGQTGEIVFDMRTFQADTAEARKYLGLEGAMDKSTQDKVQANLMGPGVLDVAKYPTSRFIIHSIRPVEKASSLGLPQYQLAGTFELHGVSRPIAVLAEVEEKDGWSHLRGSFRIKQTNYGITPYTKALGAIGVADELAIYGDVWVAGTIQELARR